jgi:hypothetical protein
MSVDTMRENPAESAPNKMTATEIAIAAQADGKISEKGTLLDFEKFGCLIFNSRTMLTNNRLMIELGMHPSVAKAEPKEEQEQT